MNICRYNEDSILLMDENNKLAHLQLKHSKYNKFVIYNTFCDTIFKYCLVILLCIKIMPTLSAHYCSLFSTL